MNAVAAKRPAPSSRVHPPGVLIAWVIGACYRPRVVRVMLLPCHIGMCIPSAGTALGIYASKAWVLAASMLLGH